MEVKVTKKDILSGYIAQIFQYGSGLIVLPVILNQLSSAEIGMNYVMLSVGALANMADFGFSSQIGRNVTYVLSGAKKIFRGEVEQIQDSQDVNYNILRVIIDASKYLYARLSLIVLLVLLTLGSVYMYHVTEGFSNVENSLLIWLLYSVGVFFNIYFLYYNSFLTGAALIMEQRIATILSRVTYIIICFMLIFNGVGLMSVVIANFISPFVARCYSHRKFYSKELKEYLPKEHASKNNILSALSDIWYTAKKSGTNTIGHYIGTQGSTFIAGAFLPLAVVGQWGIMTQLFGIVQSIAANVGLSYYPEFCKLRLQGDREAFIKKSSMSVTLMVLLLSIGGLIVILIGPWLLNLIGSNTTLPVRSVMLAYMIYLLFLTNAQLFATMMTSRNVIPSPTAVILTSILQIVLTIVLLSFFDIEIWGLVLGPAISGGIYTLWAWEKMELNNLRMTALSFYYSGTKELMFYLKKSMKK